MKASPHPTARSKNNRIPFKVFILSATLSGILLLWNLFARQEMNKETTDKDSLDDLPRLLDLVSESDQAANGDMVTVNQSAVSGLRKVAQPTPLPKIDKPKVETVTIVHQAVAAQGSTSSFSSAPAASSSFSSAPAASSASASSSPSSSSGSSTTPVTTTKSSK